MRTVDTSHTYLQCAVPKAGSWRPALDSFAELPRNPNQYDSLHVPFGFPGFPGSSQTYQGCDQSALSSDLVALEALEALPEACGNAMQFHLVRSVFGCAADGNAV